jgi:hypothetical protein
LSEERSFMPGMGVAPQSADTLPRNSPIPSV